MISPDSHKIAQFCATINSCNIKTNSSVGDVFFA